jgi:hypothetical protein
MGEIKDFIAALSPAELAKARGRRQDTSTRDKISFLTKIEELERILDTLEVKIIIKKQ